jgi:hypothetical protein
MFFARSKPILVTGMALPLDDDAQVIPARLNGSRGRPPHFGFAGAWTVCEQNRLLLICFELPQVHKT